MNSYFKKIQIIEDLEKDLGNCGTLCFGHFSVLHPGHIRYLKHAASKNLGVWVLMIGDNLLGNDIHLDGFDEGDRAEGLAALSFVDRVLILRENSIGEVLKAIKPEVFLLGREFKNDMSLEMKEAIETVKLNGTAVEFHAGATNYYNSSLQENSKEVESEARFRNFSRACERQAVAKEQLLNLIEKKFKETKILVIGDAIVDQYVACDALGMSAEAPVIVLKELEQEKYIGGAAIVAAHVESLGANCSYISVVGDDENGIDIKRRLEKLNVDCHLIVDSSRPTTFKIRYMVEQQKMFRISRLEDHNLFPEVEKDLIRRLEEQIPKFDGVLVSNFGYGCITPNVLNSIRTFAAAQEVPIFGDVQCSSQMGNVLDFHNFDMITPTEREARTSLGNKDDGIEVLANKILEKTSTKNLVLKLGGNGFVSYATDLKANTVRQHFPALEPNPIDVAGAGDSLLAALAVSCCSGANIMEASAIAACVASQAVGSIGNRPVDIHKIRKMIGKLKK